MKPLAGKRCCGTCGIAGDRERRVMTKMCWSCGESYSFCASHGGLLRAKVRIQFHRCIVNSMGRGAA